MPILSEIPGRGQCPFRASGGSSERSSLLSVLRSLLFHPLIFVLALSAPLQAQELRFSNHRELKEPEYALLHIGPFFMNVSFSQSVGYRYTRSAGTGTDFLITNRRGEIIEDGSEFPLITSLVFRNYLFLTRSMDLDASVNVSYSQYPLGTQEDDFFVDIVEEGVLGSLSSTIRLTPYLKASLYDSLAYRTDYVDTQGLEDDYGGSRYEYLRNKVGVDMDWLVGKHRNIGLTLARHDLVPQDDAFADQEVVGYEEALVYERRFSEVAVGGFQAEFAQSDYDVEARADSAIQTYSAFYNVKATQKTTIEAVLGYSIASLQTDVEGDLADSGQVVGSLRIDRTPNDRVSHAVLVSREQRGGFEAAFENINRLRYEARVKGRLTEVRARTQFRHVDPSYTIYGNYSDWDSELRLIHPLTRFADLVLSIEYLVRDNDAPEEVGAALDLEDTSDYQTWISRIGTELAVTRKIKCDVFAQHVDRDSDDAELAYTRDVVAANVSYSHEF